MAKSTKNNLGRGLDALIDTGADIITVGSSSISEIPLDQIHPNPDQPRREFDAEALAELAASIDKIGLVQPITLRKISEGNYQIISGERRWRAAKSINLPGLPAYVKTAEDDAVMEMALIENIQREDLNAIEIALAYQKLSEVYHLTHEQLSDRVGKKRTTISNYLRLLKLPAEIQMGLQNRKIDMGHARALISIESPSAQIALYEAILSKGYSVRQVEELARKENEGSAKRPSAKTASASAEYRELEKLLSERFDTKVRLTVDAKGKGSITIPFRNEKKLEEILACLDTLR